MRAVFVPVLLLICGCEGPREKPKPLTIVLPQATPVPPTTLFVDLFRRCPVPAGTSTNIDAAETALAKAPTSAPALCALGLAYYAGGGYDAAAKALVSATQKDPTDYQAWLYLGYCYLALDENTKARQALERIPEKDPHRAAAQRELGNLCFQALHLDTEAERYYQAALRAPRSGGEELLALGLFRASQRKGEASALLVKAAQKLTPGPRRAVAYAALGKLEIVPDKARAWNEKALADDPENPWAKKAFGR